MCLRFVVRPLHRADSPFIELGGAFVNAGAGTGWESQLTTEYMAGQHRGPEYR
jgi:hypothetical protein